MPVITENTNFISHRSAGVFEFIVSVHCQHFSSQYFSFAEAFASLAVGVFVFVAEQRTHGSRVCALNIIILVSCSTIFFLFLFEFICGSSIQCQPLVDYICFSHAKKT